MQNFQDNSKFINMIKNRPELTAIPAANKRILAQKVGITGFIMFGLVSLSSLLAYKYFVDASSLHLVKTRKAFTFESDPYTGKVKCSYT